MQGPLLLTWPSHSHLNCTSCPEWWPATGWVWSPITQDKWLVFFTKSERYMVTWGIWFLKKDMLCLPYAMANGRGRFRIWWETPRPPYWFISLFMTTSPYSLASLLSFTQLLCKWGHLSIYDMIYLISLLKPYLMYVTVVCFRFNFV